MKRYSYQIASVILAVAIFCLWYFKYPHILSVREQSSLFIWDWTYVEDRLSMPWGWANLLWSFIEQFFFNEALGAAIMATLSLLTLWLTWLLLNLPTRRLNSQWRIYSFFLALIPAIIVCYLPLHPLGGTEEELQYDYLIRKGDWKAIIDKYNKEKPLSMACNSAAVLAFFQTHQIDQQTLVTNIPTAKQVLSGRSAAFIMSDVYMLTGLLSLSQRCAFEAMESIEDFNKSGRSLVRLTECSLIYGQTELALKYISLLEKTVFYRRWAQQMRPLAEHPELIDGHPSFGKLRKLNEETKDTFFM